MSLRKRLTLIAAASVAVAVLLAVVVSYMVVRHQLRSQVDGALRAQAQAVQNGDFQSLHQQLPGIPASAGGPAQYAQVVLADGSVGDNVGHLGLPVSARTRAVAAGSSSAYLSTAQVGSTNVRVITFWIGPVQLSDGTVENAAVQLARPLNGVDSILSDLRLILALLFVGCIALAAMLGRFAARRVLAPLGEVSQAAQHIGETDDLSSRLRVHADDEVGRLARRFNTMLDRLESSRAELDESVRAQRQLVADAS
ncbi:MAG: HAMP domain-containing protein, partial [Solirubrobacteraceae bacterium]